MTDVTETTIRVAIIEDRREIREGLAMIINGTAGFRCAGTYRSMEDALEHIGQDKPHVVLNDMAVRPCRRKWRAASSGCFGNSGPPTAPRTSLLRMKSAYYACSSKGTTIRLPRRSWE